jgi:dihydrofolate reductase
MGKLNAFIMISIDGCYSDAKGTMNWAHAGSDDSEYRQFVHGNAQGTGVLLFGRLTYELMVQYWPTPAATQQNPTVAERMNHSPKVVFSRTLKSASWENTKLVSDDIVGAVRKLKEGDEDMTILGSGSIVSQLADAGLVDQFTVAVSPIVLGAGKRIFDGVAQRRLSLTNTRSFENGKVVSYYELAK